MSSLVVRGSNPLTGSVVLPGDKSISHRAVIFSALSGRTIRIRNLLEGEDVLRTVRIFGQLGVSIKKRGKVWIVQGRRVDQLRPTRGILYCGNSGTTMRLMIGVLAALPFGSRLTGDASLNRRPMERVMEPLRRMGARIEVRRVRGRRVIVVHGGRLRPIRYRMQVASAQVKSAILLAGRVAGVRVAVHEPVPTRDHTERMIRWFQKAGYPGRPVRSLVIPGDPSAAAFFVVAGLIHPDHRFKITIKNVLLNRTRIGFIEILKKMGGKIRIRKRGMLSGEPVGDLIVAPARLHGVTIGGSIVPRLIDEVPILAVAAAIARGRSRFHDMKELRVKESDRIAAVVSELGRFGVSIRESRDGFRIDGGKSLTGASVTSHGDHRIAMSLAILATSLPGRTRIRETDCIQTSFPKFAATLRSLGANIS